MPWMDTIPVAVRKILLFPFLPFPFLVVVLLTLECGILDVRE